MAKQKLAPTEQTRTVILPKGRLTYEVLTHNMLIVMPDPQDLSLLYYRPQNKTNFHEVTVEWDGDRATYKWSCESLNKIGDFNYNSSARYFEFDGHRFTTARLPILTTIEVVIPPH